MRTGPIEGPSRNATWLEHGGLWTFLAVGRVGNPRSRGQMPCRVHLRICEETISWGLSVSALRRERSVSCQRSLEALGYGCPEEHSELFKFCVLKTRIRPSFYASCGHCAPRDGNLWYKSRFCHLNLNKMLLPAASHPRWWGPLRSGAQSKRISCIILESALQLSVCSMMHHSWTLAILIYICQLIIHGLA